MRYTVTPIGGAKRSLRQVVADIVNYLAPKNAPTALKQQAPNGPSRYYADRGDEPGRWLGSGAGDLDLVGEVDSEDFALVLAGRDPRTGARLITAQGSAGRRPHLGVGTHTGWDAARNAIYDEHDAAAVLDIDASEVAKMLDDGTENVVARLLQVLAPAGTSATGAGSQSPTTGTIGDLPGGSYLVPVIDAQGRRWITETELTRYEEARAVGITPDDIAATGAPDDVLTIADAARLVGVTPRHLRGLALYYEQNQTFIDQLVATGQQPRQDYLVAQRNSRGWWLVKRSDLADYVHRRDPPAVRVGFDLTLTTEKSLSVLALLSDPATQYADCVSPMAPRSPNASTSPRPPWHVSARPPPPSSPSPPSASASPADRPTSTPAGDHFSTTTRGVIMTWPTHRTTTALRCRYDKRAMWCNGARAMPLDMATR